MNGPDGRDGAVARPSWSDESLDLIRAAAGGLLFGVPLLYTMEMWWIGGYTEPGRLLLLLALLFPVIVALTASAGFRETRSINAVEAVEDAVEVLAVGLVMSGLVLVLLRQITHDTSMRTVLGRIVIESVPFCLGAGVARFVLHGDPGMDQDDDDDGDTPSEGTSDEEEVHGTVGDIAATALGAAFVGLSIAPTEEVPMLANGMSPLWQAVLLVATVAISYAVVFVAGFSGQHRRRRQEGVFQHPITETMVTYLVALFVSFVLLWVFQQGVHPSADLLARVVVLGLPAAVGGAVGRLAL